MKTKLTINCKQERITKKIGKEKRLEKLDEYRDELHELYNKYQDEAYLSEDIWNHHHDLTSSIFKLMAKIEGKEYTTIQEENMKNWKVFYVRKEDEEKVSKLINELEKDRHYKKSMTKKQIHKEIRKQFYEVINEKFPQYDIDSDGFGRVQLVDGRNAIEYHMSRHTLCGYSDNSKQCHDDELEMEELLNEIVKQYNI